MRTHLALRHALRALGGAALCLSACQAPEPTPGPQDQLEASAAPAEPTSPSGPLDGADEPAGPTGPQDSVDEPVAPATEPLAAAPELEVEVDDPIAAEPEQPAEAVAPNEVAQSAKAWSPAPPAQRDELVEERFGTRVSDPYRWMEDPDDQRLPSWIDAQNASTRAWLDEVPGRALLMERLSELHAQPRIGSPRERSGRLFFTRNDGSQDQDVLCVADDLDAPFTARVLLDPNRLDEDARIALSGWVPSEDGRLVAYALSEGGSDWKRWQVLTVDASARQPTDVLRWCKFDPVVWSADGESLYYTSYPQPEAGQELVASTGSPQLFQHRLGTPQSSDRALYALSPEEVEAGVRFGIQGADEGRMLFLRRWRPSDRHTELDWIDLTRPQAGPIPLVAGFDARHQLIGVVGWRCLLTTDLDAPRRRIVAVDRRRRGRQHWVELVPQGAQRLRGAGVAAGHLFASYLDHAASKLAIHTLEGARVRSLPLPGTGTVRVASGRAGDSALWFHYEDPLRAAMLFRVDPASGLPDLVHGSGLELLPSQYVVEQHFVQTGDGTRVPIFLTRDRALEPNGEQAVHLYGYGGFDIATTPRFNAFTMAWVERGGIAVTACLRGGGEYGEDWHAAGTRTHKQNTFDDFHAVAQWLIDEGWTRPSRLAIAGRSNGGLLVGACITQRPELYGAALPAVGVLDMLRFHEFTVGSAWIGDYGDPDDPEEFAALRAYSPLHNVSAGTSYPATMILTGDRDDRVVPAHSFKFAATLQEAQVGAAPVLLRVETRAGHGAGTPKAVRVEQDVDRFAFCVRALEWELAP